VFVARVDRSSIYVGKYQADGSSRKISRTIREMASAGVCASSSRGTIWLPAGVSATLLITQAHADAAHWGRPGFHATAGFECKGRTKKCICSILAWWLDRRNQLAVNYLSRGKPPPARGDRNRGFDHCQLLAARSAAQNERIVECVSKLNQADPCKAEV
jgi:hypothetical protein